jgi:hypothetical protein
MLRQTDTRRRLGGVGGYGTRITASACAGMPMIWPLRYAPPSHLCFPTSGSPCMGAGGPSAPTDSAHAFSYGDTELGGVELRSAVGATSSDVAWLCALQRSRRPRPCPRSASPLWVLGGVVSHVVGQSIGDEKGERPKHEGWMPSHC